MKILKSLAEGQFSFYCPGCKESHTVNTSWQWNGSWDKPTFTPSVLVRTGHYVPSWVPGECWCTYSAEHPEDVHVYTCHQCHSFVTEGKIRFLEDCTHALAGQTVDLPLW